MEPLQETQHLRIAGLRRPHQKGIFIPSVLVYLDPRIGKGKLKNTEDLIMINCTNLCQLYFKTCDQDDAVPQPSLSQSE